MIPISGICDYSHRNTPSSLQNDEGAISILTKKKSAKKRPLKAKLAKTEISLDFGTKCEPGRIEILLPLRTVSEANCFEAWRNKHKRHKAQKRAVMFAMIPVKHLVRLPCTLRFVRYAPRPLDAHDNLRISLKYILDQTCAEILNDFRPGRADAFKDFTFEYDQVKSKEYAVKIEILF